MSRELLFSVGKKDLRIDTFRTGGSGGQNRDKRDTGVRITHIDSGAVGSSQTARTQGQNKKLAFQRMLETKEWKNWHRVRTAQALGQAVAIEEKVDGSMRPENLKVEVRRGGRWVTT